MSEEYFAATGGFKDRSFDEPISFDWWNATCEETLEAARNNFPDYEFRCSGEAIERRRKPTAQEDWSAWKMIHRCPEHT